MHYIKGYSSGWSDRANGSYSGGVALAGASWRPGAAAHYDACACGDPECVEGCGATCAGVGCAVATGPTSMTFVGAGRGDFVTETSYRFVGAGEGNLTMATPTVILWGRIAFCVTVPLLLVLIAVLFFMRSDTTTTTAMAVMPTRTPPPVPRGECTFWGDPHGKTFDGGRPSFYGEGESWVVRSETVSIQGRFKGTEFTKGLAATSKIAVGGVFLKGHVIAVGSLETGPITVDGRPVLLDFPSTFHMPDGVGSLTYNGEGRLVDGATQVWEKHVVHMDLPNGVSVTVLRWKNYLDFRVVMPAQPGQDGACGNFNGRPDDDTTEAIMSRIGARVEHGMLLFRDRADVDLTPAEEKLLAMCPHEKFVEAQAKCPQELSGYQKLPGQKLSKACMLDHCFGSNEHALRLATTLGL